MIQQELKLNFSKAPSKPGSKKWSRKEGLRTKIGKRRQVWEVMMGKWQGCHGLPNAQSTAGPWGAGQAISTVITLRTAVMCMRQHSKMVCVYTMCLTRWGRKTIFVLLRLIAGNKLCIVIILAVQGFWIRFCSLSNTYYPVAIFWTAVDLFIISWVIYVIYLKNLWLLL